MTDYKRRTLRMWAKGERDLSFECDNLGPLLGWVDAVIELQLLKERETKEQCQNIHHKGTPEAVHTD